LCTLKSKCELKELESSINAEKWEKHKADNIVEEITT
jgi:hypothetical protein